MENLILWGVPVIGALIGLSSCLFKSYITLLNLAFAAYLSLWSEGLLSSLYRIPGSAEPYKSAATMLFCSILAWVLLNKLTEQLKPDEREFAFPPILNKLGGALCGFLGGMVAINFAAFVFCTTPQKTVAADIVSVPALEKASAGHLVSLSRIIDDLSFQGSASIRRTVTLDELIRKADPAPAETPHSPANAAKHPGK